MKDLAFLIILISVVLIVKGYYENLLENKERPKTIVKYIPMTEYEEQLGIAVENNSIEKQFGGMFDGIVNNK
jgi:hypothetical protein